jgi:hypothetical protein
MPGPVPSNAPHICYWVLDATCVCPWRHGYIGVTKNRKTRQRQHLRRFKDGTQFQILFRGSQQECRELEYALRPVAGIGWNKSPGGQRSQPWTSESRAKVSEAMRQINTAEVREKKRQLRLGYVLSEETKKKISRAHKGHARGLGSHRSEETRRKMSEAQKGKPKLKLRGRKRPPMSEEWRRKISEGNKGRRLSAEHRRKLSEAGLGRIVSEETRRKISESVPLRPKISEETRRRMSEANKRRPAPSAETRLRLSESGRKAWLIRRRD